VLAPIALVEQLAMKYRAAVAGSEQPGAVFLVSGGLNLNLATGTMESRTRIGQDNFPVSNF
jgi:hypothetical protein